MHTGIQRITALLLFGAALTLVRGVLPFVFAFAGAAVVLRASRRWLQRLRPSWSNGVATDLASVGWFLAMIALGWVTGPWISEQVTSAAIALPELMRTVLAHEWVHRMTPWFPDKESVVEYARSHGGTGLVWVGIMTKGMILMIAGALVSIVAVRDEASLQRWRDGFASDSLTRTLWRWWDYVMEGITVMLTTQVLVAGVNALLTLPLLMIVGLPQIGALTVLVFVGSLVPVVGNIVVGLLLAILAMSTQGTGAAISITVLTAVLHKVESYWINPRLAAPRIGVPPLLVILALVFWERVLGLSGVFVAIPSLVVLQRLRQEWAIVLSPASSSADTALSVHTTDGSARVSETSAEEDGPACVVVPQSAARKPTP